MGSFWVQKEEDVLKKRASKKKWPWKAEGKKKVKILAGGQIWEVGKSLEIQEVDGNECRGHPGTKTGDA